MKLRILALTAVLGAASVTSVHAQAPDPCTLYLCMAGISGYGTSGGAACTTPLLYWHAIAPAGLAVYSATPPTFVPPASATLRRTYMQTCPATTLATNAAVLEAIITMHGYLP